MTIPSNTTDVYWIVASREIGNYPAHTIRGGKWLIFTPIDEIDRDWEIIKIATNKGELGFSVKVSTLRLNPHSRDPNTGVICVYTYDSEDVEDVMTIRESLRNFGFTRRLTYKSDQATREGRYGRRVTKYVS